MNLFSVAEWLAAFGRPDMSFDAARCLHHGDKYATCQACFDVCPAGAITPGKPPVFSEEKCLSCSACLPVCPSGAYRAGDPLAPLLQAPRNEAAAGLDLFCASHPQSEVGPTAESAGYRVKGCLAGLSAGSYMALVAQGYQRIWVRTDACQGCPWKELEGRIQLQVSRARSLLALWGQEDALVITPALEKPVQRPLWSAGPASQPAGISRRDLFRMMIPHPDRPPRPEPPKPQPIENEDRLSQERVHILRAAGQLALPLRHPEATLEGLGFAGLSVSADCTACGACARACPTDALRFSTDEAKTSFRLSFQAEACIGCEACLHVCSPAAITLRHAPEAGEVFTAREARQAVAVRAGALAHCERCQTPFAAREGQHLCSFCEYRSTHPFGSILPPGVRPLPRAEEENRV